MLSAQPVPLPRRYVHSFAVTERYIVVVLYPLTIPFDKLANGKGFLPQLEWHGTERGSTLVVWDMQKETPDGGSLLSPQTWRGPPCWAYHIINAYNVRAPNLPCARRWRDARKPGCGQASPCEARRPCCAPDGLTLATLTQDGGKITVDLNAYRSPEIVTGAHGFAYLPNMRGGASTLEKQERDGGYLRLRVNDFGDPTPTRKAESRWLRMVDAKGSDWTFELVRISEAVQGGRHRFAYGFTGFVPDCDGGAKPRFGPGGAIVKMDTEAAGADAPLPTSRGWVAPADEEGCVTEDGRAPPPSITTWQSETVFPSEPLFVGRPGGTAEDDGVLLFLGYETVRRESFLGVLDAAGMRELARVYCGTRCCISFHGQWIPAATPPLG